MRARNIMVMGYRVWVLVAALLLVSGWTSAKKPVVVPKEEPDSVMYLRTDSFLTQVCDLRQSEWKFLGKKPCIIDFYTTWCGPCKRLAPIMQELAKKYKGQIYFYKMDIERERNVAQAFGISSIPQVLYCPLGGDKPTLTKGLMPQENIEEIIRSVLLK